MILAQDALLIGEQSLELLLGFGVPALPADGPREPVTGGHRVWVIRPEDA
jgi:hypothetical protein